MLRSLTFRTKLLCTLAVPMVALLAITAIAGRDRQTQADRADRLGKRIGVVGAALDLDHQVQHELALSPDRTAGSALTAARAATDRSVANFTSLLGPETNGSTNYDHAASRVRADLKTLASSRASVDGGATVSAFGVPYAELAASLSDLAATIGDEAADPTLGRDIAALATLSRVSDATAAEWATIDAAASRGNIASGESGLIRGAVDSREQWEGVYQGLASGAARDTLRALMIGNDINVSNSIEAAALRVTDGGPFTADVSAWRTAMAGRLDLLHRAEAGSLSTLSSTASQRVDDAQRELRTFLAIAGGSIVFAAILGLLLVRTISRPLRRLTTAAQRLADQQLPALVDRLKNPGPDDPRLLKIASEPIEVLSTDELGQLTKAFNTVQTVAVDVAVEQAELLRKGIADIFVSLARRNQVLIDRQIEFLDELEAAEDDPDQLGSLYRLDHLATRMRRNAESLLVLAGAEPTRRRAKPVPLIDVVRAAIGETEQYARVDLISFEEVGVSGNGAVDLGHLLAELLDNATHFSPPETKVTVEGRLARNGYVVSIVDHGIGMSTEQLADANGLLASPPPVGLALGRSLGFTVVARLAARHGVTVRLMPAPGLGTSVVVHLPAQLIATSDAPLHAPAPAATSPLPTPPRPGSLGVFASVAETPSAPEPEPEPERERAAEPEVRRWVTTSAAWDDDDLDTDEPGDVALDERDAFDSGSADTGEDRHALDDDEFEQAFQRAWGAPAPDTDESIARETDADVVDDRDAEAEVVADATEPRPRSMEVDDDGDAWGVDDDGWSESAPEPSAMPWSDVPALLPTRQPQPENQAPPLPNLEDALPTGTAFDRGLADLMRGDDVLGPAGLVEPPVELPPVAAASDAGSSANGPELTSAGLVRRVPKATSAGPDEPGDDRPSITANRRSPEEVRAMLAEYRTGLQRGHATDDDTVEPEAEDE